MSSGGLGCPVSALVLDDGLGCPVSALVLDDGLGCPVSSDGRDYAASACSR